MNKILAQVGDPKKSQGVLCQLDDGNLAFVVYGPGLSVVLDKEAAGKLYDALGRFIASAGTASAGTASAGTASAGTASAGTEEQLIARAEKVARKIQEQVEKVTIGSSRTASEADRPVSGLLDFPLPLIHKDFDFPRGLPRKKFHWEA